MADGEPSNWRQDPPQPGLVHHLSDQATDLPNAVVEKMDASRVHERELLRRAARLIDPDVAAPTYEERLDWLAKYREVIS